MRKDYQLALSDSKLVLQLTDPQNFDLSVFSDQPDDLFAGYSRADGQSGRIEYPIENMISLRELLNQITPGKQEACSLLNSLFSALNLGMKNQPVVLDLDGIFFSFHADALCLVRAPLVMECWMKRQEDLDCFIEQLLDHLDCDGFEISGLLWKARKESKPLEAILADLDSLNQASQKRKLFFRKPVIEPFSLKKPVYPDLEGRKQNMANPPQGQSDLSRSRNDPVSDRPAITRLQTENQLPSGKPDEAFSWLPQSGFDQKPENRPLPENDEQAGKEAICQPDLFGPAGKASDFSLDFQNWTSQDVLNFFETGIPEQGSPDLCEESPAPSPISESREWEVFRRNTPPSQNSYPSCKLPKEPQAIEPGPNLEKTPQANQADGLERCRSETLPAGADLAGRKSGVSRQTDFERRTSSGSRLEKSLLDLSASDRKKALDGYEPTMLMESIVEPAFLECQGKRIALEGSDLLAGRGMDCQVRLEGPGVSMHHARLVCQAGRWYIQDLKSTNGTFIGQKQIVRRMRLKEGMTIRFGNLEAVFFEHPVLHS